MPKRGKSAAKAPTMAYVAIPTRPKGNWLAHEAVIGGGTLNARLDVELIVQVLATHDNTSMPMISRRPEGVATQDRIGKLQQLNKARRA
jgi:hypothetical protein